MADGPMKIYVGGLVEHLADVTDSDLRSIFNPFGEIESIDMPKDTSTMKSKGYCFIEFRKASQAKAAISAMNGFKFKGKTLKVGTTTNDGGARMSDHIDEEEQLHALISKQALMHKLNRDVMPNNTMGFPTIPNIPTMATPNPQSRLQSINTGMNMMNIQDQIQSACLLLGNLFDPTQINLKADPNFYADTKQDVFEECSNFGRVDGVWVDQNSQGNVWVKFSQNNWQAARTALEQLNGR